MKPEAIKELVKEEVRKALSQQGTKALHPSQLTPGIIKQRHVEDVVVKYGLAADRPTDGDAVGVLAYFSYDDDTLAFWNKSAWVEEILT